MANKKEEARPLSETYAEAAKAINSKAATELGKALKAGVPLAFILVPLEDENKDIHYALTGLPRKMNKATAQQEIRNHTGDKTFKLQKYAEGTITIQYQLKGEMGVSKNTQRLWFNIKALRGGLQATPFTQLTFNQKVVTPIVTGVYMVSEKLRLKDEKGKSAGPSLKIRSFRDVSVTTGVTEKEFAENAAKITLLMKQEEENLIKELAKSGGDEKALAEALQSDTASLKAINGEIAALAVRWANLRKFLKKQEAPEYVALGQVLQKQVEGYMGNVSKAIKKKDAKLMSAARYDLQQFLKTPQGKELDEVLDVGKMSTKVELLFERLNNKG